METIAGCHSLPMAWPRLSDFHGSRSMFISCRMFSWVARLGIRSAASPCSGNRAYRSSGAAVTEPGRPEAYDVGNRLGRIREDACGVDQRPAPDTLFDPFLYVLVEPLEADGHGGSSHLVQHEIIQTRPRLAANVERLAVPFPPVGGKT